MEIIIFMILTFLLCWVAFKFVRVDLGFIYMFTLCLILLGTSLVFGYSSLDYSIQDVYSYELDSNNISQISIVETDYVPKPTVFSHGLGIILVLLGFYLFYNLYENYN